LNNAKKDYSMKVVIRCCSRKLDGAGRLTNDRGDPFDFVAHPALISTLNSSDRFARPDDQREPSRQESWREYLIRSTANGQNPDRLVRAGDLYTPPAYRAIVNSYGWENVFILSAGWGLVRSDFLLPMYDITFSAAAEQCNRRKTRDEYQDFNHLLDIVLSHDEPVHFFGGNDYLQLYYTMIENIDANHIIHYAKGGGITQRDKYSYFKYRDRSFTNWHYSCVLDFIASK